MVAVVAEVVAVVVASKLSMEKGVRPAVEATAAAMAALLGNMLTSLLNGDELLAMESTESLADDLIDDDEDEEFGDGVQCRPLLLMLLLLP